MTGGQWVGVMCGLGAVSCGPAAQPVTLGMGDRDRTVLVAVDEEVDLTLQTVGGGSYGQPDVSSAAVVFQGVSSPAGAVNPAGQRQLYVFQAVKIGNAVVRIPHVGDAPEATAPPFVVTLNVR
jgi:hypothetical protein